MNDDLVDVEEALVEFVAQLSAVIGQDAISKGRVIRDVFGKLSFLAHESVDRAAVERVGSTRFDDVAAFVDHENVVTIADNDFTSALLAEVGQSFFIRGLAFTLLDRRIAGDDWLQEPKARVSTPPRLAFYGLKGGVGRSTALAIAAADLAASGKNVLVIDLDLEAPGLGSILLREDQQPDYGVLDWLAYGAVGGDGASIVSEMVGGSQFTTGAGVIDVVPAVGRSTEFYPTGFFPKLARAYTPGAASGKLVGCSFTDKIDLLIENLLERRSYDAVLLDVRAGLHESSAASILGLGAYVLLFGVASSQTLVDYRILFCAIRQSLSSWTDAVDLRGQMRMIQGRAGSASGDQVRYRTEAWQLWLETLYDAAETEADISLFSFDLDDAQGPHFPWIIPNSDFFLSFDPRKSDEFLMSQNYQPVFGSFLAGIHKILRGDE